MDLEPGHRPGRRIVSLAWWLYGGMVAVSLVWGGLRGHMPQWWTISSAAGLAAAVVLGVGGGALGVGSSRVAEKLLPGVARLADRSRAPKRHPDA